MAWAYDTEFKYEVGQRVYVINSFYEGYGTVSQHQLTVTTGRQNNMIGYIINVDDPSQCSSDIDIFGHTKVYAAESHVTEAHGKNATITPEPIVSKQEEDYYREIL